MTAAEKMKLLNESVSQEIQDKYWDAFEKQAMYLGNGIYKWAGIYATDTRELFLLGCAGIEGIEIEGITND